MVLDPQAGLELTLQDSCMVQVKVYIKATMLPGFPTQEADSHGV